MQLSRVAFQVTHIGCHHVRQHSRDERPQLNPLRSVTSQRLHKPTEPSSDSRRISAWPLCRAYSWIMWSMMARREIALSFQTPVSSRRWTAATARFASHSASQIRTSSSHTASSSGTIGLPSTAGSYQMGASSGSERRIRPNQLRSTSARWRTRPWSESSELLMARSFRCSSVNPSHFADNVAR